MQSRFSTAHSQVYQRAGDHIAAFASAGLLAPVYFKHAVDAMGQNAVQMTVAALLTSGLCRVVNGVAKEIQHPCFTPISQVSRQLLLRGSGC